MSCRCNNKWCKNQQMKKRLVQLLGLLIFSLFTINASANDKAEKLFSVLEGHWEGAFIKNNSYQKFDIQFYKENGEFSSLQIMEEWHPQFGEFVVPVSIDSMGQISFNSGKGKALMHLDSNSLELVGTIEGSLPVIHVHLKKVPQPPKDGFTVEEITLKSDTVSLYGHLHVPNNRSTTAIIIVGGRSCYAGSTKYDLWAKLLREYGISVLVYNKRGTGKSTRDCATATIADLANDVVACKEFLSKHSNGYSKIGVIGSSAGGWVMMKAQEKTSFDFLIGVVGPSTSVYEQQMQSMEYGLTYYDLPQEAKKDLLEYTNMMFSAKATKANFARFKELLALAERDGWYDLLDDTDIPPSVEGIDELWVRRHSYDPKEALKKFDKPFLAIYGENDWIVPYKENIARLEECFSGDRLNNLTTIVAHEAEHGTDAEGRYVDLDDNKSYWRFFRISPKVQIGIIDFLMEHKFIE